MSKTMGRPVQYAATDNIVAQTRRQLELKQSELADLCGVSPMAISHWENGSRPIPDMANILCRLLLDWPDTVSRIQTIIKG